MLKRLVETFRPNPFDTLLKHVTQEGKNRFLVIWNRGLGDIPLGLYALVHRIRCYLPHASITFLTRPDLADGFKMLDGVNVLVGENWERGKPIDIEKTLQELHLASNMFDVILEKPDPTKWLKWQVGSLVPKLTWQKKWDQLIDRFGLDPQETYIGCHVQTETGVHYGYEKNWDLASWRNLFKRISDEKRGKILLFGMEKQPAFLMHDVVDLRGETTVFEMLAIIKNCCRYLVVPDSGVLSIVYYVNAEFPIRVVSLWADAKQGVLRQNVPSPNSQFEHIPLHGKNDNVANISVNTVHQSLFG
ncbi:MAG: glycosyltransferase family 9 protein [Simkaniaceae bacterium]